MTPSSPFLTRRHFIALSGGVALWPSASLSGGLKELRGSAFGTSWSLTCSDGYSLDDLRSQIEALFDEVDRQMSPWRPDSTISRFNASVAGSYLVEDAIFEVSRAAIHLSSESGGCFDPTVGPLVAKWGFGPVVGDPAPDWAGLNAEGGHLSKASDGLTLDLCGIAKGWALDRACELARASGVEQAIFDLGGEVAAIGAHPSGREWQVAIEDTRKADGTAAVLRLPSGHSIATSGKSAQSYSLAGKTYGHIIDPRDRQPADGELWSVSVIARTAMDADGWATALFAAGAEEGPALAAAKGIDAVFLGGTDANPMLSVTGKTEEYFL